MAVRMLLRPLPYPEAGDLRTLRTTFTDGRMTSGQVASVEIDRFRDGTLPIEEAALTFRSDFTLIRDDNTPMTTRTYGVGEGFFELFGLPHHLGAGFTREH